jgi:hypothetical protein
MKSTSSYSFYTKDINKNKYDEFVKKASDIRDFKNNLSLEFSNNLVETSEKSKIDLIKEYGSLKDNQFTNSVNIRGQELQKAVVDVITAYENKFSQVKSKMSFKVQSKIKITHYKRKTGSKNVGDVKTFEITTKSTPLTKCMTYLARYGFSGITSWLASKNEQNKEKAKFYMDVHSNLIKFGEERLLSLAMSHRKRIVERYNHPITFNSLSYRSCIQSEGILIKNHNGYSNAVAVIPGMNGRKIVVPTPFNAKHHGHLNQYKSKDYLVLIDSERIRFILTKEVERNHATGNEEFIGVDTNVKHNLFCTSIGEEIDFDRTMFNGYISFLKKYNMKEHTRGQEKQFNLWQTRIQGMLKAKASELVELAIKNNKNHIVMEDLSSFGRSFIKSEELGGFKYSRLVRLLNLSSLNKLVRSICQKKGVQLTLIHSHYTSQACSCCGNITSENRKSQEEFKCVVCGHTLNADLNSSINIHLFGQQEVLARLMLKEDSSSWFVPKKLRKETIRSNLEDIIISDAFQQNRMRLDNFIYSR